MLSDSEYLLLKKYFVCGVTLGMRKKTVTWLMKLQSMKKEVVTYYEDYSMIKTAKHFDVPFDVLKKFLHKEGIRPPGARVSSLQPKTMKKIDELNVVVRANEEIAPTMDSSRELLTDGFLAEKYGITRQAINLLRNKVALPSAREISAPQRERIKKQRKEKREERRLDKQLDSAEKKRRERLESNDLINRALGLKFK